MSLSKADKQEIKEMIREALAEPQDTVVESPTWKSEKTLKVMVDGEEHEIALNPYFECAGDGNKIIKTELTWDEAMEAQSKMPDGWRIPTRHEFVEIIEQLGQDESGSINGKLAETTGWSGNFWSTTEYNSSHAWYLYVDSSYAYVDRNLSKSLSNQVVCYR